ncbi:MFS transporter [Frischella sp. Ac48]|uniref:MFS transporter n=1 Tax=Frischella japonica TaxID=2741544 RepID=A0ABR7R0L5_9GAMM|nr:MULTISPECIES: MFS transporter [Frischella]MBC9131851.1 MFS transporter [Frischella japonica]MBX4132623.1 MFS transporter [Frischella sp. Ac48]
MNSSQSPALSLWVIILMAIAVGIAVASNYYAQPLLHSITNDLNISIENAGIIITTAQFSYAVGLLFVAPLGDKIERKVLIINLMILTTLGLIISALANSSTLLIVGTAIAGIFSAVAQVLIPFAATLALPNQRGKVVGILMSGMLLGILLGRTFAGAISTMTDWRMVYWVAAAIMCVVTLLLSYALPRYSHKSHLNYWKLIFSIFGLYRHEHVLRIRSLIGGIAFALFSLLWTPLAFLLTDSPYHYSDFVIGLFGLAGAAGAMSSPIAGRLSDKGKGNVLTTVGLILLLLCWLPLSLAKISIIALIIGIIIIDFAVQLTHISSMNDIYQGNPAMRTRLNVGYMLSYFTGGMLGSLCSTYLYAHYGWYAIAIASVGLAIIGIALWWHYLYSLRQQTV